MDFMHDLIDFQFIVTMVPPLFQINIRSLKNKFKSLKILRKSLNRPKFIRTNKT